MFFSFAFIIQTINEDKKLLASTKRVPVDTSETKTQEYQTTLSNYLIFFLTHEHTSFFSHYQEHFTCFISANTPRNNFSLLTKTFFYCQITLNYNIAIFSPVEITLSANGLDSWWPLYSENILGSMSPGSRMYSLDNRHHQKAMETGSS